jgi:hypothetical protein
MTYSGPERRRQSRKREVITTRLIMLAVCVLLLGLLWLGYSVVRYVNGH